jgi:putative addiction module killer protein
LCAGFVVGAAQLNLAIEKLSPMGYNRLMLNIRTTDAFDRWFHRLRDLRARARVQARIDRLAMGNPGDHKSVGGGINELRIDEGPGYRVYYTHRGSVVVILLCGGNKSTQQADIDEAKALAANLETD